MGHIITLILDLLTHWTVPSWFSCHDCTQQREKCGMCKWFALLSCLSKCVAVCSPAQFVFPCVNLVIQLHLDQWIRNGTCSHVHLIHSCVLGVCVLVCAQSIGYCKYVYVCTKWPLQHVAWWVCGAGLVRRAAAAVWRSGLLLQRKAYVGLTGQAVQGSHQNEPFMRSDANSTISLHLDCRKKWPNSDFCAHMWLRSVCFFHNRVIFSILIWTTFICSPKSDTGQIFLQWDFSLNSHIRIHDFYVPRWKQT